MGLRSSGWDLTEFGAIAATVDVGMAIGGGRFSLDIKDQTNTKRKLTYGGVSFGVGAGARLGSDADQAALRFILNIILPLFRGGFNTLNLPARQSQIFLNEGLFSRAVAPLSWNGDFIHKTILLASVGIGLGAGLSGSIIFFFPNRVNLGLISLFDAFSQSRAIAFSSGIQIGQVGADFVLTPCYQADN